MPDRWPFFDDKSTEVVSLKRILARKAAVLLVTRDDEGNWQFLDGEECSEEDAAFVTLGEMVQHDATLREVAALPPEFFAVRETVDGPWDVGWDGDDEEDGEEEGEDDQG